MCSVMVLDMEQASATCTGHRAANYGGVVPAQPWLTAAGRAYGRGVERITGVMQTPDGYWRVEAYRQGPKTQWYRVIHGTSTVVDKAALATVQRILGDQFAELQPVADAREAG